ncbi:MAG: PH domain-containing protein [Bacteroidales bacterium]|nr:PH domain-containing protein [Bacteroidales bacterium]
MKSKVSLSRYSLILTALLYGLLFVGCIVTVHEEVAFFILLSIYVVLILFGLMCGVAYIKVDSGYIWMCSILRSKKIPVGNVESVELFQPTMGAIRIVGSGGFMGYWGIFREGDIGRYYAFYGKSSECFLVRMKNGDKYVLGCDRPDVMADYIKAHMK